MNVPPSFLYFFSDLNKCTQIYIQQQSSLHFFIKYINFNVNFKQNYMHTHFRIQLRNKISIKLTSIINRIKISF